MNSLVLHSCIYRLSREWCFFVSQSSGWTSNVVVKWVAVDIHWEDNGWLGTTVPNSHGRGPLYSHRRYRHPVQSVEMGSHPRLHGCPQTFIEWRLSFSDKRQDVTSRHVTSRLIFISRVRSFLITFRFGKSYHWSFDATLISHYSFFSYLSHGIRVSPIRFNHSFILFF